MVAVFRIEKVVYGEDDTMTGMVGEDVALGVDPKDGIAVRRVFEYIHALLSGGEFRSSSHSKPGVPVGCAAGKFERGHFGQGQMLIAVLSLHVAAVEFQV